MHQINQLLEPQAMKVKYLNMKKILWEPMVLSILMI